VVAVSLARSDQGERTEREKEEKLGQVHDADGNASPVCKGAAAATCHDPESSLHVAKDRNRSAQEALLEMERALVAAWSSCHPKGAVVEDFASLLAEIAASAREDGPRAQVLYVAAALARSRDSSHLRLANVLASSVTAALHSRVAVLVESAVAFLSVLISTPRNHAQNLPAWTEPLVRGGIVTALAALVGTAHGARIAAPLTFFMKCSE
jgi:hypothetical protein